MGSTRASAAAPAAATNPSAYIAATPAAAIIPAPVARTDAASFVSTFASSTC